MLLKALKPPTPGPPSLNCDSKGRALVEQNYFYGYLGPISIFLTQREFLVPGSNRNHLELLRLITAFWNGMSMENAMEAGCMLAFRIGNPNPCHAGIQSHTLVIGS